MRSEGQRAALSNRLVRCATHSALTGSREGNLNVFLASSMIYGSQPKDKSVFSSLLAKSCTNPQTPKRCRSGVARGSGPGI